MAFDPQKHLTQLKNGKSTSDYLEVKWRLVWFREQCPEGTIETKPIVLDLDKEVEVEAFVWNAEKRRSEKVLKTAKGVAVFHATVTDGKGGSATGTKSENAASFADFIEKAESGSIGRALAALGYGTQFTGDELNEKERIVDSPVTRENEASATNGASQATGNPQRPNNGIHTPAQPEQPTSSVNAPLPRELRKRCDNLFGQGQWDAYIVHVLKAAIPEGNLTPEDCNRLKQAMDSAERKRQQPKAS